MDCGRCRGACCEFHGIREEDLRLPSADVLRWLKLHAERRQGWLLFNAPCRELTASGRCGIYETRPQVCRDMPVGQRDCFEAVRRRRTAAEYAVIRDPDDPEPEELYRRR